MQAEFITEAGPNLEIWRVDIKDIKEQDVNAQFMVPEMFNRLSENVKKESRLESIPFTVKREDHFELVSGHHRVRAARKAGLKEILVLADTRDLERSQVVAKQIAHNRLAGESNQEILDRMVKELSNVDDMIEAYVDMKDLGITPPGLSVDGLAIKVDWRMVTVAFLPDDLEQLKNLCDAIPESDMIGAVPAALFKTFKDIITGLRKSEDVRSLGLLMGRMLQIAAAHMAAKEEEDAQAAN